MAATKISIVKYVNAMPLVWGILEGPGKGAFEPIFSTPAECAEQLASGQVDVGLIPSIEYQNIPGARIVPGPAIASRRRAMSVILLSLTPLAQVRTVAADPASRSSAALARVVFQGFYRTRPEFHPAEPDPAAMLAGHDAALLIGDVALRYQAEHAIPEARKQGALIRRGPEAIQNFDLMERWGLLTGLPFVFAFWATRKGFRSESIAGALAESRAFGLERLSDIAGRSAERLNVEPDFVLRYLSRNLDYHMDADGIEALRQFYSRAARAGVIRSARGLEFL